MGRSYITNKVLFITKQIQIIKNKDYIITAIDANNKIFFLHVIILKQEEITIHSYHKAWIKTKN